MTGHGLVAILVSQEAGTSLCLTTRARARTRSLAGPGVASAVDTLTMNTSDRNTHHRTSPATLISRRFSHKPTVCTRNPLAMTPNNGRLHPPAHRALLPATRLRAGAARSRREPSPGHTPCRCSSDQTPSTHPARTTHAQASGRRSRSSATDPPRSPCSRSDGGYYASTPPNLSLRAEKKYCAVPKRGSA